MSRSNKVLHLIFAGIVVAELASRLMDNVMLEYFVKPLIMVWIAIYFLRNAKKRSFRVWVLLAFFFSWTGDMFLMFSSGNSNEMFFYVGIGQAF